MVDPDFAAAVQSNGITTPHVLRVEVGNLNVLNDNIADPIRHPESFALDDATATTADQRLIRRNLNRRNGGVVVRDRDRGRTGLIVGAPAVQVDGRLAARRGAPWRTARARRRALGADEVECLGQYNGQGLGGSEVVDQLGGGGRRHGRSASTARGAGCEPLGAARDGRGAFEDLGVLLRN